MPTIRAATEDDVQLVFDLIVELATYEKLRDEVVGTPEILRASLFDRGDAEALIVESGGEAVGYAIFYTTFSTFECRSGIWLEDVDGRQFIHFETGNHLGPEHDPLRIAANGLRYLPQPRRLVIASRQSCLAVGAQGHGNDLGLML